MIALVAALLVVQGSPPLDQLKWLIRHQREDGAWSGGPVGCECAKDQPTGKAAERDPAVEKKALLLLEALKSDESAVSDKAVEDLVAIGPAVEPILRQALRTAESPTNLLISGALKRVVQARVPGDVETTSLALLAMLGAGYSHLSKDAHEGRLMGDVVKNGLKWLMSRQRPSGLIGEEVAGGVGPGHVLATLVLAESYALTGTRLFKQPGLNALDYVVSRQRKSGAFGPGRDDAATTAWFVLVCHSAKLAEFEVSKEVTASLVKWLDANSGKGRDIEAASYVMARSLLVKDVAGLAEFAERLSTLAIANAEPLQRATSALALLHHEGVTGERWLKWRKSALPEWRKLEKEGCERGSCAGSGPAARLTSLNVIALEGLFVYSNVLGSPKTRDWPPPWPK